MFYLYSGIDGKGCRLEFTAAKIKEILKDVSIYPVNNKGYQLKTAFEKSQYSVHANWIYYVSRSGYYTHKNDMSHEYKSDSQFLEAIKGDRDKFYFVKNKVWEYEKEFRIVVCFHNEIMYDRIAVSVPIKEKERGISLTCGPEILNCEVENVLINEIYKRTGIPFIIIIDEWDCVIRNSEDKELVHKYLQFLHSLFKSEESKSFLALAYITGILPIKKIKDESVLNNFKEYTMLKSKPITQYYGFTEEEVKGLCEKYDMNFDTVKAWYNGYLIDGMHMYNPNSVSLAMLDQDYDSYWKNTSSFETINTFITMNYDGLRDDIMTMLADGKVSVNTDTFQNDLSTVSSKDEALTALIHLGYLGYDSEEESAYIPNFEVKKSVYFTGCISATFPLFHNQFFDSEVALLR